MLLEDGRIGALIWRMPVKNYVTNRYCVAVIELTVSGNLQRSTSRILGNV
jgi:hypothetical protein